jgi:hypothetical protein
MVLSGAFHTKHLGTIRGIMKAKLPSEIVFSSKQISFFKKKKTYYELKDVPILF